MLKEQDLHSDKSTTLLCRGTKDVAFYSPKEEVVYIGKAVVY